MLEWEWNIGMKGGVRWVCDHETRRHCSSISGIPDTPVRSSCEYLCCVYTRTHICAAVYTSQLTLRVYIKTILKRTESKNRTSENMATTRDAKRARSEEDGESESIGDHFPHFATAAIHAGQDPEQWKSKAVVPLISLSTTFKQDTPGKPVSGKQLCM